MTAVEKCGAETWDGWHSSTCGRPVKRLGMCGIHARAQEVREENSRKRREDEARRNAVEGDARSRLAAHGVAYSPRFTAAEVADILDGRAS